MDEARLSIVVPTIGRDELARTLDSAMKSGLLSTDEIIVVGDGPQPKAAEIVARFKDARILYLETARTKHRGVEQRNMGMAHAQGTHLLFIDDDDAYVEGALTTIHEDATTHPGDVHIYKMQLWNGCIYWKDQRFHFGNIGTPMFMLPNRKPLAQWAHRKGHDFFFLESTMRLWKYPVQNIVWHQSVVVEVFRVPDEKNRIGD